MDFSKMIDKDLVFTGKTFSSKEEAIRFLSLKLLEKGIVKKEFVEAVLEREKKYPTGLYLGEINVAIPHTDIKHVLKSGVAILTLSEPVMFGRMDDPNEKIPVNIIFLLSIFEPKEYTAFLSKLTKSFGDKLFIKSLYTESKGDKIATLLKNILKSRIRVNQDKIS